jgi:hypothetical protein
MNRICMVVLDHRNDEYLRDLIDGVRTFCPHTDIVWYNSGHQPAAPGSPAWGLPTLPTSRPLRYAKVTPFFIDLLEWAAGQSYDYVVNLETDMCFVRPGFERFVDDALRQADYLAAGFERAIAADLSWRPYRTLVPELPELLAILGVDHLNRAFSPGQVFTARYVQALVNAPWYGELRAFVDRNQQPGRSFTLQEVLLPTLSDALGLTVAQYPAHPASFNRFRPYQTQAAVGLALVSDDVHFLHPVYRHPADGARQAVRRLVRQSRPVHH